MREMAFIHFPMLKVHFSITSKVATYKVMFVVFLLGNNALRKYDRFFVVVLDTHEKWDRLIAPLNLCRWVLANGSSEKT